MYPKKFACVREKQQKFDRKKYKYTLQNQPKQPKQTNKLVNRRIASTRPTTFIMPRIQSTVVHKCFAFLQSHPDRLCACAGKYVVDGIRYCGTHKKSAEKAAAEKGETSREAAIAKQHTEKPDSSLSEDACPICYDPITTIGDQMTLECGHAFHKKCAATWISTKESCPMCRAVVHVPTPKDDDVMAGVTMILAHLSRLDVRVEAIARPGLERMKALVLAHKDHKEVFESTIKAMSFWMGWLHQ